MTYPHSAWPGQPGPHPAHLPQVGPYRPAASAATARALPWVGGGAGFGLIFLLLLGFFTVEGSFAGVLIGFLLASLTLVLVLSAFVWIDRVEPEPLSHLAFAFGWGATVAVLFSYVVNSLGSWLLQVNGAVVMAPVVEETAKGCGLLVFLLFRRRHFDGIVDGIVLAGFVAAGFAFTENILYLARAFTEGNEHGSGVGTAFALQTFLIRGVLSPFAHPLFTAMTGIGCGIAAVTRSAPLRVVAPFLGWCGAVFLHFLWNASSTVGESAFWLVYLLLMVPLFGSMIGLVVWSRRLEMRVIARHLPAYAAAGWLAGWELPALTTLDGRRRAREWAQRMFGGAGRRAMVGLQLAATELAFLRERASRGYDLYQFAQREQELLTRVGTHKQVLLPAAQHRPFGVAQVPAQPTAGPRPPASPGWPPQQFPAPRPSPWDRPADQRHPPEQGR